MHHLEEQEKLKTRVNSDEIDLSVVFKYVGRFFKRVGDGVGYLFASIRNHWLVVAFTCLIGVGLGFAAYSVTKPYYVSSMTFVLSNIRNEFIENQLDKLSEMVGDNNFEAVAEGLDINVEAARQIKSLKFSNLDQERIDEDSILTGSPFEIELALYKNELFSSMEPAIANYLESNRYFSKQKRIKQKQVESMISKLKNEIASIDSLKTTVSSPRGPVNGFVYGEPIDPTNLYRESIGMYKEQVSLEAELEQLNNIEVVNGFSPRRNPTGPNLLRFLLIGGLLFLPIGIITALAMESKKRKRLR